MRKIIFGGLLAVVLFLMSVLPVAAATYYVDTSTGADTNTGLTQESAWKTLTPINNATFLPGDTVYFKRGQTFTGKITLSNESGTSGSPITFGAYGEGADPIINATAEARAFDLRNNASYITIEDLEIKGALTEDILLLGSMHTGITIQRVSFVASTRGININGTSNQSLFKELEFSARTGATAALLHQGTSTSDRFENITVNGFQYGLQFTASTATSTNMVIDGFTITQPTQSGILLKKLDGATLTNVTVAQSLGNGIFFQNGQKNLTIQDTVITNSAARGIRFDGLLENLLIEDTTVTGSGFEGVYFLPSTGVSGSAMIHTLIASDNGSHGVSYMGQSTGRLVVTNSTFNGNGTASVAANGLMFLGSGFATTTNTIANENSNDGFNIRNTIHTVFDTVTAIGNGTIGSVTNGDGDGISWHNTSTGVLKNSVIRNNKKSGLRNVDATSVVVYNTVFSHDTRGTVGLLSIGNTSTAELYNNTLYTPSGLGIGLEFDGTGASAVYNTIVSGFEQGIVATSTASVTEDYNLVYGSTLQNWTGIAQGSHSISQNPQFVNAQGNNFQLTAQSPAINTGRQNPYSTLDKELQPVQGNARDIGAYEYQGVVEENPTEDPVDTTQLQNMVVQLQTMLEDIFQSQTSSSTNILYLKDVEINSQTGERTNILMIYRF